MFVKKKNKKPKGSKLTQLNQVLLIQKDLLQVPVFFLKGQNVGTNVSTQTRVGGGLNLTSQETEYNMSDKGDQTESSRACYF